MGSWFTIIVSPLLRRCIRLTCTSSTWVNGKTAYDAAERVLAQKKTLEDYNNNASFQLPNHYESVESITAYENVYSNATMEASRATSKFAKMFQDGDLRKDYYFGAMSQSGNYPIKKTNNTTYYKCSFRSVSISECS